MLQNSFGFTFFLKASAKKENVRAIYLRVTIDGISKEASIKQRWDATRWNQKLERATGTREDAKTLNLFLDSLQVKISQFRIDQMNDGEIITAQKLMHHMQGKSISRVKVLEEFENHNKEVLALVPSEYAMGTYERFVTARSHVKDFISFKYGTADIEFRELNFEFVKDYELYLKTVRKISNNTALKYIANFKKIVLRAIDKEIITADPFKKFKSRKTKILKKPLDSSELASLEDHTFSVERLAAVRDIFVFQCYTGLAYVDAYNLKKSDIRMGIDGELWIITQRQKTDSPINIPLLPQALKIVERYKEHPLCLQRGSVLPVVSNRVQLDFKDADGKGNFAVKQYHENYGYDLEATLAKHPIKELDNNSHKDDLINSLRKGNLQSATFIKDGHEVKQYIEANPQFKSLNVYDDAQKRVDMNQSKGQGESEKEGKSQKESQKAKAADGDDESPGDEKQKKQHRKSRSV